MNIITKYDVGDKVWLIHNNAVKSATIIKIDAVTEYDMNRTGTHTTISYCLFDYCCRYLECKLFPTKEELLKSL